MKQAGFYQAYLSGVCTNQQALGYSETEDSLPPLSFSFLLLIIIIIYYLVFINIYYYIIDYYYLVFIIIYHFSWWQQAPAGSHYGLQQIGANTSTNFTILQCTESGPLDKP